MYSVNHLSKVYVNGEVETMVLHDVSFSIEKGAFVTILGTSGSGKTTLLNILSGLDHDYGGSIQFQGQLISTFSEKQFVNYRKEHIALVFQQYHLLPTLNVKENIMVASDLVHNPLNVESILSKVGMLEHQYKYPNQLSGGQKQRTAIARAIVKAPKVIFCDEPTGALDSVNAESVMSLLKELNKNDGVTIIMVTHHEAYTALASHVIRMSDGRIVEMEKRVDNQTIEQIVW